ncbi:hypothetical protein NGB36_32060 [Streptomyces sp. RB6PN25]|uniref:Lipoprotein n=1 Tax=Streptomyces humicola TaxID=2953240 RepID=A0ABT1Q6R9_9ACTN|nr:hypothetical protein [Streptomyces humicola]MCQ4085075.1 hypothetical protein [Streptomyces humicola]
MPPMLDVSDEVRAEIGDSEADRLLAGENAPTTYDCTSCRTPGHTDRERTSTVLFVGEETAVLAFAHASCIPSQVVPVSEEQLQGAVRSITAGQTGQFGPGQAQDPSAVQAAPGQAVLGITAGLVMCRDALYPSLVVEPTGPVGRPGSTGTEDEFLTLLAEQGFHPVKDLDTPPDPVPAGWSVLLAVGKLHAVLQPGPDGGNPTAWWQAHQPLAVSEGWRAEVNLSNKVLVFASPAGTIGRQPREDMLREALLRAVRDGKLMGGMMPLAGT